MLNPTVPPPTAALPDFVIIGAQKSGSTALMKQLAGHPEVYLPESETRYFRDPWFQFESVSDLARAVGPAGPAVVRRGIKCPDYLAQETAATRIHDVLGADVSLVAVLREPVSRAISAYFWGMQWGYLPLLPPDEGLARILDGSLLATHPRSVEILEYGRYATHLRRWIALFGRDRLEVLLDTDLRDLGPAMNTVYDFLGVARRPPTPVPSANEGVYNPTRLRVLSLRHRHILREFPGHAGRYLQPAQGIRGRIVNRGVSGVDRLVLARLLPNDRPPVSASIRSRLAAFYADEVAALADLLPRDLSAWQRPNA